MNTIIKKVVLAISVAIGLKTYADDMIVSAGQDIQLASGGSGVITVEDGGSVDIANIGQNSSYSFVIAGSGVNGKGAIYDSSNSDTATNTIAGLTLLGDATIKTDSSWGVLAPDGIETVDFRLNSFTLTKKGSKEFVLEKFYDEWRGIIDVKEGGFELRIGKVLNLKDGNNPYTNSTEIVMNDGTVFYHSVTNFMGNNAYSHNTSFGNKYNVKFKENSTLRIHNVAGNLTSKEHLVPTYGFCPSVPHRPIFIVGKTPDSVTSQWATKMGINLSHLNPEELIIGEELVIITNLTSKAFPVKGIGTNVTTRFDVEYEGKYALTARVIKNPPNLWHYDFDNGYENLPNCAVASDSTYQVYGNNATTGWVNNWPSSAPELVDARGGKGIHIENNSRIMFVQTNGKSQNIDKEQMTVVSVIKPVATDKRVIWSIGMFNSPYVKPLAIALVAEDEQTLAVYSWEGYSSGWSLYVSKTNFHARVTGIPNLTTKEHFVAFKASPFGSRLIVDDMSNSTTMPAPKISNGAGSFGGYSPTQPNPESAESRTGFKMQDTNGCILNDIQVYNTWLTDEELNHIKKQFWNTGFSVIVR